MSVREILCERMGVDITTAPSPRRAWNPDDLPLLKTKDHYCVSYDNNMLVEGRKYSKVEVDLPDWLDTDTWCANYMRWNRLLLNKCTVARFGARVERFLDYPEVNQRAIESLCQTKAFKSAFRRSLYDQLVTWMDTDTPDHKSPFSPRQWDSLTRYLR